ncbi:hypothetical protein VTH06DRAFT_3742 [Thermothelomyces fergusii]
MSADLFAAFGDGSQASATQQNQQSLGTTHPVTPAKDDLFSFLSPTSPTSPPQGQQQPAQWSPFQQTTTEPPPENVEWGDIGGLGALEASHQKTGPRDPGQEDEDDDGWGEFEVAQTSFPAQPLAPQSASVPPGGPATASLAVEMVTNSLVDLSLDASAPEPWERSSSSERNAERQQRQKPSRNPDPNVLFDADFEADNAADDDDDFGDFETGASAVTASPNDAAKSAVDLLSLDPEPVEAPTQKQPAGVTMSNNAPQTGPTAYGLEALRDSIPSGGPEPAKQLKATPTTVSKAVRGANAASPSPATTRSAIEAGANTPATDWEWQDWGGTEDKAARGGTVSTTAPTTAAPAQPPLSVATSEGTPGPPPTNIPPPAILLSLFPSLLDLAQHALLKPLLTLPPSSPAYQRVLAAEATYDFLRGYLALAAVAARLITGRKHRWHRDKFLVQGMSVSVAAGVGGQRGMKLASVDKAHAAHDDREAAEVAAAWKRFVGRLRAVVAGVNAARGAGGGGAAALRVPEVAVGLAVTTAKGAPTAPRACVVCGLRRDERVAKVDFEVEDSFGEWWVEFWGHRDCRNFWLEHEKTLRQR